VCQLPQTLQKVSFTYKMTEARDHIFELTLNPGSDNDVFARDQIVPCTINER